MTSKPTVGDLLQYLGHNVVVEQGGFYNMAIAVPVRMRTEEEQGIIVIKLENGKSLRIHCL